MWWILIIVGIVIIILFITNSENNETVTSESAVTFKDHQDYQNDKIIPEVKNNHSSIIANSKPVKKAKLTPVERKWNKENEYAKSIFKDHWGSTKDYSHLEPWEAEDKLDRMKELNGWVDDDVFYALRKIIRGDYPITEIPNDIDENNPEVVFDWYMKTFEETNGNLSVKLMKHIATILKPYHESYLLTEIRNIEPSQLSHWVDSCKSLGYFFSPKVYNACKKKYLSQFEKPNKGLS